YDVRRDQSEAVRAISNFWSFYYYSQSRQGSGSSYRSYTIAHTRFKARGPVTAAI
ncbi:hypothetical protein HAX54_023267, partial [Datura stramonium]|nr:hypothetical protein [Datura stramonium]